MIQPVDLVNKQDISRFQACQYGGQVSLSLNDRPGGHLDVGPHLMGNDIGQGCLAQTRKAMEKNMVKCFFPCLGCLDEYLKVFFDKFLADVLGKFSWSQVLVNHQVF